MEQLDELAAVIWPDCAQCISGIEQNDIHLLEIQKPRMNHYITILSEIAAQIEDDYAREVALSSIYQLQTVMSAMDSILERDRVPGDGEFGHSCLSPSVDSAIYLRHLGMPWSKIATAHGLCRRSMYNFRKKHHIVEPNREVDDEELRNIMFQFTSANPSAGAVYMKGALTAMGLRVTFKRVKEHLRQVNPSGTLYRRRERIHRRKYKVKGANYLWHMDSNHKLIAFRMVLHGCIDGFSRKLIYLNIATNNLADTVLAMFEEGVRTNAMPKRVRGDKGIENVRVKEYMEVQRPEISKPWIQGRSIHNTRIERLWRETNIHVSFKYRSVFNHLEQEGMLDEHDEIDLLCLAYVFVPRIQEDLNNLVHTWNNHPMSSMNGRTPLQVWTVNMLQQRSISLSQEPSLDGRSDDEDDTDHHYDDCHDNDNDFDEHCQGSQMGRNDCGNSAIVVPQCPSNIVEVLSAALCEIIPHPLANDGNHGIDLYIFARNYVLNELVQLENGIN